MQTITINEIFASINGEVNKWGQGSSTVFIRLQGCNLKCSYCDTDYAQNISSANVADLTIPEILETIKSFGIKRVTITGGEPLLQSNVFSLINELLFQGYQISVETNGSIYIPKGFICPGICWVVDYKTEFSKQMIKLNYRNLCKDDFVKFVIKDKKDFDDGINIKNMLQCFGVEAQFAFSPAGADTGLAGKIVVWLLDKQIDDVVLNLQLHKIIEVK